MKNIQKQWDTLFDKDDDGKYSQVFGDTLNPTPDDIAAARQFAEKLRSQYGEELEVEQRNSRVLFIFCPVAS